MCVEWEGTHWNTVDVHVPCGSTVSSVTDASYIQAETSQRVSVKSTVSQVMPATDGIIPKMMSIDRQKVLKQVQAATGK
jgi:hypothetical protein